ncbi:hypothetical protein PMI02_01746 [Novosphingobium sp. AP12]|nr:hypothetical protein PMI02_01746 [Novosphingobium sp. AP12]
MDLLSVIRRWHFRQEISIREFKRRTGLSRNTIRKYLRSDALKPSFKVPVRPSKLAPFAEKLTAWLRVESKKSHKQKRIFKQLYVDLVKLGYDGSYNRVAAFARRWRTELQRCADSRTVSRRRSTSTGPIGRVTAQCGGRARGRGGWRQQGRQPRDRHRPEQESRKPGSARQPPPYSERSIEPRCTSFRHRPQVAATHRRACGISRSFRRSSVPSCEGDKRDFRSGTHGHERAHLLPEGCGGGAEFGPGHGRCAAPAHGLCTVGGPWTPRPFRPASIHGRRRV